MTDPTPDLWRRIRDVFDAVADLPDSEQSDALDAACRTPAGAPDEALRAEVERLLQADLAGSFLDAPAADGAAALVVETERSPDVDAEVGAWRIVREIGRGGMGAVSLVERADGAYDQRAALKRLSVTGPDRTRRFERERQILAELDHPGIARLLDGGVAADGTPYLVMEYVEGVPITEYASVHGLDTEARAQLFTQVCDAVGHAHRHLVVHRDLKPSNVLVAEGDDGPTVKLLDFGIAKLLEATSDDEALTRTGLPLLTPEYAAPEQIAGGTVTTATDVYALGVLLYELLAERRPYEIGRESLTGIVEAVRDTLPPLASAAASGEARQRALRGDLDAILAKALEKAPGCRYGSADELADDLRRHFDGLPVTARPQTAGYRARRFVRRHRVAVAAVAVVALAVVGGLASTLWQARQVRQAAAESEAAAAFLADLLGAADPLAPERRDTLRIGDLLDAGAVRVREDLADEPRVQARLLHVLGSTYRGVERWEESEPLLREAVALHRDLDSPPAVLAPSLLDLALTQSALAAHSEAVALAEEGLRLAHRTDDPEVLLQAERTLGSVWMRASAPGNPDSLFWVAQQRARRLYGDRDFTIAELELNRAEAALNAGRLDDAEQHSQEALQIATEAIGADHPRLIDYHLTLSFIQLFAGRIAEAEEAAAQGVALARALSPGSNRLGQTLTSHAQALRRLGRLDEAEAELREAIPYFTRRLMDQALPFGTLASVLEDKGDLGAAIAAQRESYGLLQNGVARHRPAVVSSAIKLARMLTEAERYAAAEVVLGEAEAFRAELPEVSDRTAAMLDGQIASRYLALYEAWGRPADADRYRPSSPTGAHDPGRPGADHGTR